jgi:hypothetical protein
MFNLLRVDSPSYWPIIVPLLLSVDMLNDSMTLRAHESVKYALFKRNVQRKNEESKANGTFEHDAILELAKRFAAGAENNRREVRPPSGFEEFAPRLFAENSGDAAAKTLMMEFVLPGVTPGQAFTSYFRYSHEELGTGTDRTLQVFSKTHRVFHATPADTAVNRVVSRRDFVGETVWKKLQLEDGSDVFLSATQRKILPSPKFLSTPPLTPPNPFEPSLQARRCPS